MKFFNITRPVTLFTDDVGGSTKCDRIVKDRTLLDGGTKIKL